MNIQILCDDPELIPTAGSAGASGFDLRAAIDTVVKPGSIVKIPTGVRVELDKDATKWSELLYEAQVRSRSGLASRGIVVANSPGTVDSDYKGEICVLLMNQNREDQEGSGDFHVKRGDRIAQLVFGWVIKPSCIKINNQENTESSHERGSGGFGSTGVA